MSIEKAQECYKAAKYLKKLLEIVDKDHVKMALVLVKVIAEIKDVGLQTSATTSD